MPARVATLPDRALLAVTGADAESFLDRLVTADVDKLGPGVATHGALLSPQGKILTDFLLSRTAEGFLIDLPAAALPDLLKRLTLYRLRAAVGLSADPRTVSAVWDGLPDDGDGDRILVRDERTEGLGHRLYAMVPPAASASAADYAAHRIGLGIPEIGADFAFGEAFPHDVAMDQLSGVAFDKGCYVGQEVVSRMQHRGTARRRPVIVSAVGDLPPTGTEILAAGRAIGSLGSVAGRTGLAVVRLDRAKAAMDEGLPILAGPEPVVLALPGYARYGWPSDGETD